MTGSGVETAYSDKRLVLGVLWIGFLGAYIGNIQPMFLGALADARALDAAQIGSLAGAELSGVALASLAASIWYPRANLRLVATFALMVAVVGNAATAWVLDATHLVALRFAIGFLGTGVLYALSFGLIGQSPHPDRLVALAVILQVVGMALSLAALPAILEHWQLPGMTTSIALVMLSGVFVLFVLPTRATAVEPGMGTGHLQLLPIGLLACMILFSMGLGGLWAFLERIGDSAGYSAQEVGNTLALGGLIGGLGAVAAFVLGLRYGRLLPLLVSLFAITVSSVVFTVASSWSGFLTAVLLFNFFWNFTLPYLMGAIAMADRSGRSMVVIPAAQGMGLALGPVLTGSFIVGGAYSMAGQVSATVFVACMFLLVPLLVRLRSVKGDL